MTTTLSEISNKSGHNNNNGQLVDQSKVAIGDSIKQEEETKVILSTGITPDGTKYYIRRMKFEDIEEVLKVWKEIGLYEGTNTIQSFLTIDPEGFYVAINEKDGSIIGEVGGVFVEPSTAFIGLYAVRPDYQGSGIGIAVWRVMMKHVGDANVGLLAIEDQYNTYKNKAKLQVEDEVKMIEYKSIDVTSSETISKLIQSIDNVNLIRVMVGEEEGDKIINQIISYDRSVTGHDRGFIVGCCAGVFVDPDVAFIGLYAVKPEFQGKGIGTCMWKQMMSHIGDKNVGLYAVPKHLITYRDKAGFRVEDTIKVLEYEGTSLKTEDLVKKISNIEIKRITDEILQLKVIHYDQNVVNFDRSSLLKLTFNELDALSMVAIDKDNGSIVGFGCLRTNNINRAMAGPIYANNDAVAELIVYNLITNLPIALIAGLDFMTPDCNPGGLRIASKLGLKKNEDLPRLFVKSVPKVDWNRIYCIHTPNFSPY